VPALQREFGYSNPMEIPRLTKITLNIGLGEARENARAVETATADMATITGQKPVVTRAKKAISNFKIRENMPVGAAVTLRGDRMYEFLDRLLNVALPRIRDFHGVAVKAFDGRGNFSLGLREQLIFPEIDYDKVDRIRGMQVNIITSARNDEEGRRLLELMGMPFAKERQ
jgi:large subunit ribosomal protein L5